MVVMTTTSVTTREPNIKLKRAYAAPEESDGYRVLVDRLWPRGTAKAKARIDLWLKEIAPSTELRKWFGHDPEKFDEFAVRYQSELQGDDGGDGNGVGPVAQLLDVCRSHTVVTLVFAAKDEEHNNAVVLKGWLEQQLK